MPAASQGQLQTETKPDSPGIPGTHKALHHDKVVIHREVNWDCPSVNSCSKNHMKKAGGNKTNKQKNLISRHRGRKKLRSRSKLLSVKAIKPYYVPFSYIYLII